MPHRAPWLALLACLGTLPAVPAAAGAISAELTRTEGGIDETFGLTIFVEGNLEGDVATPQVSGLAIQRTGYKQSLNIVNGQTFPEISLIYSIHPQQSGSFTIPSISAVIDGKRESTVPLKLSISPAGQAPSAGPGQQGQQSSNQAGQRPGGQAGQAQRSPVGHEDTGGIFIERECASDQPFVGEQIVCAVRVFHRDNLVGGQRLSQNSAEVRRFTAEGERRYAKVVNGQRYSVIELREILVPKKGGDIEVPPFVLQARVLSWSKRNNPLDKFFDRFGGGGVFNFDFNFTEEKEVTVKSEPQILKVKELPATGQPAGFAGVVGQYNLSASVSRNKLPAGETVTITVEISGIGVLDSIPDLKLPLATIGRLYPDKPEYKEEVDADNGIRSSKIFKFALVPGRAGEYPLGAIDLPVFNPKLGQYTTLHSDLGSLIVEPGTAEEKPVVVGMQATSVADAAKRDIKMLGEDLIGPHRSLDLTSSHALRGSDWLALSAIGACPMALALGFMGAGFLRARRGSDPRHQRRARALRSCESTLRAATQRCAQGKPGEGLALADRSFREFLGDKLGLAGAALTSREITMHLERIGLTQESLRRSADLRRRFERVEFAGQVPAADEASRWIDELDALAREVDRLC